MDEIKLIDELVLRLVGVTPGETASGNVGDSSSGSSSDSSGVCCLINSLYNTGDACL